LLLSLNGFGRFEITAGGPTIRRVNQRRRVVSWRAVQSLQFLSRRSRGSDGRSLGSSRASIIVRASDSFPIQRNLRWYLRVRSSVHWARGTSGTQFSVPFDLMTRAPRKTIRSDAICCIQKLVPDDADGS
jgi:hypothetical protein